MAKKKWYQPKKVEGAPIEETAQGKIGPFVVTINGTDLCDLDDEALRKIAQETGFPDVSKLNLTSMFGGRETPSVLTVDLATATRYELIVLLASRAPFVPPE
jgi:hypothetical protein